LQIVYDAAYLANNLAIQIASAPLVPQWLSITSATAGQLLPGECAYVRLNFNALDLAPAVYTGNLVFTSNDVVHSPVTVPVSFVVGLLDAPSALTIRYIGGTTPVLSFMWTNTGAPYYILYSSTDVTGTFTTIEGSTTSNSITIPWTTTNARKFFEVKASYTSSLLSPPSKTVSAEMK
jgi:hypothetical protein